MLAIASCGGGVEGADELADSGAEEGRADGAVESDAGSEEPVEVPLDPHEPTSVHDKAGTRTQTVLFKPGVDEFNIAYHSFRIPSIITTREGTLLAFAEGRQCGPQDAGNINLVFKRSTDHGKTWSKLGEVIGAGAGTWGNPTAVADMETGKIFLFMSWNDEDKSQTGGGNHPCTGEPFSQVGVGDRRVYLSVSEDDGKTWSAPENLTATLQPPNTTWDAIGPGVGIQTIIDHPGRLIVPAIKRNIFSDDHGETWQYEEFGGRTSEGTIVELSDGTQMRNDRAVGSAWNEAKRRWVTQGTIEGGFPKPVPHDGLIDPRVEGSALRYTANPHRLLFLNPASTTNRCKMRVRISYDDGKTWPISRKIHPTLSDDATCSGGYGGYSSMTKTFDQHVAILSERNPSGGKREIELIRVNLPFIVDGTVEPVQPL